MNIGVIHGIGLAFIFFTIMSVASSIFLCVDIIIEGGNRNCIKILIGSVCCMILFSVTAAVLLGWK